MSGRSHDRYFVHNSTQGERLISRHTNRKKGIPGAIPYPVQHCSHQNSISGIPCQSPLGIHPSGLTTTGFNGIKTDAGIPFHTRGGIPPEALPAKASG